MGRSASPEVWLDPAWSVPAAQKAEQRHHQCLGLVFGSIAVERPWGTLVLTPDIPDEEWNHGCDLRWPASGPQRPTMERIGEELVARERDPVVVLTPWSAPPGTEARAEQWGWAPCFRHQWAFWDLERVPPSRSVPGYDLRAVASPAQMEAFIGIFTEVYDTDGALAPGYAPALRRSFDHTEVRHLLVWHGEQPVATGTLVVLRPWAQMFNMIVLPSHRRRGLAQWLLHERVRIARDAGARRILCLTENDRMDAWIEARGFTPAWHSVGYAPSSLPWT